MDKTPRLYLAEDIRQTECVADDTEFIERRVFPFGQVLEMVTRSEITDSMTVIAILHAARRGGL